MSDIKTFVDVFHTIIEIVFLLAPALPLFLAWKRKKRQQNYPKPTSSRKWDWISLSLYVVAAVSVLFSVGVFIIGNYFPGFVITYPPNGHILVSDSREVEISGVGAYPGNNVYVYVSDGHTQFKQLGVGIPSKSGNWAVQSVVLQTPDFEYSIWAETEYNGVTVLTNNRVTASRVDANGSFRAFVKNDIAYVLIVLIMGGMLLYVAWNIWGEKIKLYRASNRSRSREEE